jgi:hypothetical protein
MRRSGLAIILGILFLAAPTGAPLAQSTKAAARDQAVERKPPTQIRSPKPNDSIKGRVVGEGNQPVAGTAILAFPVNIASNPQAVLSVFRRVLSDADGKFELAALQPGAYTILANSAGYVLSESDAQPFYRPGETVTLTLVKGGVITGRVTNTSGDSLVGASVRATKIRETDNKPVRVRGGSALSQFTDATNAIIGAFKTDDRGIYRLYGLTPGVYQVAAGGRGGRDFGFGGAGPYDSGAPTYYPSSTIDTAAEVTIRAGDEVSGIDIRYRDHRGHSISGSISGTTGSGQDSFSVLLTRAGSGIVEATSYVLRYASERGFVFDEVLDGEFFVTAMGGTGGGMFQGAQGLNLLVSQPRRVTVTGGDVTGIELALDPLASIAGRALIEPLQDTAQKAGCKSGRTARLEEIVISAPGENKPRPQDQALPFLDSFKNTTPTEKGEFTLGFLRPGVHRLDLQLSSEILYVKSATLPPTSSNTKPIDAAKNGFALKSGDKMKGLIVTLSEGAAGLRGKVVTGEENKPPAQKLRVHLVPAEPEAVDEVLRYFEAEVASDASFSLTNLAPGKYWLVAREMSEQEQLEADRKPLAWNSAGRMGLRFEGDASKKVFDLSYCQRLADSVLKYTPLIEPSKRPVKKPAP